MPANAPPLWPVLLWDRLYRAWHRLDHPEAAVPPVLCLALRRSPRAVRLAEGVIIAPGDPIAELHLDNRRVTALHGDRLSPRRLGLEFRRLFRASLFTLARRAESDGPLSHVKAFVAVTIFYEGLERLGFEADDRRLPWSGVVGMYQRALLARMHPSGRLATHRRWHPAARRWISRERLLARYGRSANEVA